MHGPDGRATRSIAVRLILFDADIPARRNFYPLALSRPIFELRCGITSLREKMIAKVGATDIAYFVPEHIAPVYRAKAEAKVNDPASLKGADLLLVSARLKTEAIDKIDRNGPSQFGRSASGEPLYLWLRSADVSRVDASSLPSLLESAQKNLTTKEVDLPAWGYTWDLVLASPHQITADFKTIGRSGIEGSVEQPNAIRGSAKDVYIAKGAKI